ncbi:hypothetical protein VNO77_02899 [Canavalia gladiata]|uniref:Uncharacterized protein n=1 Tax=Canavalia gladiata TaxID=3824 RepID=A0AAN9MUG3_CANGL
MCTSQFATNKSAGFCACNHQIRSLNHRYEVLCHGMQFDFHVQQPSLRCMGHDSRLDRLGSIGKLSINVPLASQNELLVDSDHLQIRLHKGCDCISSSLPYTNDHTVTGVGNVRTCSGNHLVLYEETKKYSPCEDNLGNVNGGDQRKEHMGSYWKVGKVHACSLDMCGYSRGPQEKTQDQNPT